MKFKLLVIFFLFLSFKSFSQEPKIKVDGEFVDTKVYFNLMSEPSVQWVYDIKPDTEKMALKGQVKSVKTFAEASPNIHKATKIDNGFVAYNGKILQVDIFFAFNKEGYLIERSSINTFRKGSYREVYEYDKAGNKIKAKNFSPYDILVSETRMEYNEFNQKTKELKFENDTLVSSYIIEYDQENKIVTSYFTQADFNITRKSVYEFTEDNERKKLTFYDFENNINRILEYTYNKKGLIVEKFFNDIARNNSFKTIYKYNKLDKLISEVEYDKFNKVVNQKYIEYDKKGNLIKNASTRHDHEEYETTAIDEQGNWTEITISTLGFIEYIKHREIKYF